MKKIANIVSQTNITVSNLFNVVKTMDECIHGLPTLVMDYDYINKNYPDFDILEFEIIPNLYWTFSRRQKRDKHDEDLQIFINKVYSDLLKGVTYFYLDFINYQYKTIIRAIRKIYNFNKIFVYEYNEMLYIYVDNIVFGIDLKLLRYMGFNTEKIKDKINRLNVVFLRHEEILIEYKMILGEIENQVRYIPYLLSIFHEETNPTSNFHIPRKIDVVS
jgi:hypothetical protein